VDDVTTTGTTLKVAAEVLEKEGYTVSRGLVCCYAPPGGVVL
jgi:predicted amidophosphoribosyltransferase